MSNELGDAIRLLVQDSGISEDLVRRTVEEFLLAAYKKKYGTADNAVVRFAEDGGDVTLYAQRKIVEDVYDPVSEVAIEEALAYNEDCELGDELLIEINPDEFDRVAVQSAKQKARQTLREIKKDTLHSEFKDKVGEMIIGYYQRERNGNIFVDLGKTEGILPKRYQSPREVYRPNDRIKAMIYEVNKNPNGLQIVLTRTHTEFVKRIFELEVPEVYDQTVEIVKLVREPGYRTKIAVYSNRDDVDPVGACVGLRGVRIQGIVRELEGEKIDILKYDNDPREFIRNALSPAEVSHVVVLDESKRQALAVVPEGQLSLAIGKQGLNVRLANRLVDWSIDVKTQAQFSEMDLTAETKRAVSALFGELPEEADEITRIAELPEIPQHIVAMLEAAGHEYIEDLINLTDEELETIEGLSADDVTTLKRIIAESVEIIETEEAAQTEYEDEAEYEEEAEYDEEAAEGEEPEAEEAELPEGEAATELAEPEIETIEEEEEEEITLISELPNIDERVVEILNKAGIEDILDLLDMPENKLRKLEGITEDDVAAIQQIISDNVEIIEEDEDNTEA
ncbi:MAG TPA: transcription termination factor NusA [Spirochaetia bacterium]|nr:transcription termination factor NusA [Spirochaetia bacterium]